MKSLKFKGDEYFDSGESNIWITKDKKKMFYLDNSGNPVWVDSETPLKLIFNVWDKCDGIPYPWQDTDKVDYCGRIVRYRRTGDNLVFGKVYKIKSRSNKVYVGKYVGHTLNGAAFNVDGYCRQFDNDEIDEIMETGDEPSRRFIM